MELSRWNLMVAGWNKCCYECIDYTWRMNLQKGDGIMELWLGWNFNIVINGLIREGSMNLKS